LKEGDEEKKTVNLVVKSEVQEKEGQLFVKQKLCVVRDCHHDVISYNSSSSDPKVQPHFSHFCEFSYIIMCK